MHKDTREVGNNGTLIFISAFKIPSPPIHNVERQVSLCKPQSLIVVVKKLPRLQTIKLCSLIGKPSFAKA